jgi:hypothetical protein
VHPPELCKSKINTKVKIGGQECPPHTCLTAA